MSNSVVLVIGGPNTGKTNYLCRVWLAMENETGSVRKDRLPSQIEYIESGARHLLEGRFAERTPRESFNRVELPFRLATGGARGILTLPDVSGEDCSRVYLERKWGREWESCIPECVGCLMFLREGALVDPLSWIDVQPLLAIGASAVAGDITKEQAGVQEATIPTQTLLVEWLQFLRQAFDEVKGPSFVPRIGIVVAAWDLVGEEISRDGPRKFVASHTPLLSQYIITNQNQMKTNVFGTSVVGGDLTDDKVFRDEFLGHDPHDSGFVVLDDERDGRVDKIDDLTLPLAWVLGATGENPENTAGKT